jgi:O-antigen/teichoic acid export membrane protein
MTKPASENTHDRRSQTGGRRVWQDIGLLAAGQVIAQLANLVSLAVVARLLSVGEFGLIQVAIAVVAYLMVAAELGLFTHGVRELSRLTDAMAIRARIGAQGGLLIVLAVFVIAVSWWILPLLPVAQSAPIVFRLYLLSLIPQAFMHDWVALGRSLPLIAGLGRALRSVVYAVLIVGLASRLDQVWGWPLLIWIPALYLLSYVVGNAVVTVMLRRALRINLSPSLTDRTLWFSTIRETAPIGGAHVVRRLLFSGDLLLLGFLATSIEAGQYAVAAKLGFPLVVGAEVAMGALLPRLSKAWNVGAKEFADVLRRQLMSALAIAVCVTGVGIWIGPTVVIRLFGDAYLSGAQVLRLVLPAYALLGLGILLHDAQVAAGSQRKALIPLLIAVLVGIGAGIAWIPESGAAGAARMVLVSHSVYALGGLFYCRRLLSGS